MVGKLLCWVGRQGLSEEVTRELRHHSSERGKCGEIWGKRNPERSSSCCKSFESVKKKTLAYLKDRKKANLAEVQ